MWVRSKATRSLARPMGFSCKMYNVSNRTVFRLKPNNEPSKAIIQLGPPHAIRPLRGRGCLTQRFRHYTEATSESPCATAPGWCGGRLPIARSSRALHCAPRPAPHLAADGSAVVAPHTPCHSIP